MTKSKSILLFFTMFSLVLMIASCGHKITFQKTDAKASISYEELEAYYLENSNKLDEPIKQEDKLLYREFKDILISSGTENIKEKLAKIESELLEPTGNYQNKISLYLLIAEFYEALLGNNQKALSIYAKIWSEYKALPLLHPNFDPEKKEFTPDWYLIYSDAEALMKAGDIYSKLGKKEEALACYNRILRYYGNEERGSYTYDFPDKYGRIIVSQIIKIEPAKPFSGERTRCLSGDRRVDFTKLAEKFPEYLVNENMEIWLSFIPDGGLVIGYDQAEKKWTAAQAVSYQLQKKTGPQYDMLVGWLKGLDSTSDVLNVKIERQSSQFRASIVYPKLNKTLYLDFDTIQSCWYLTGIYFY